MNRVVYSLLATYTLVGCDGTPPTQIGSELSNLTQAQRDALNTANSDPLFNDTDIGLWIRGGRIAEIIRSINSLPESQRSVIVQVIKQNGNLIDEADYYLNLDDLPNNNATGVISNIEAEWTEAGALAFGTEIKLAGAAKIHAHYTPVVNTGVHMGINLSANTRLNGNLNFLKSEDPKRLFEVNFELLPSPLSFEISTNLTDNREVCWRTEFPCAGTWRDPIRTCEARDCKTLWQYDIPISFKFNETIRTDRAMSLPIEVNLPDNLRLQKDVQGVHFDKSIKLTIHPQNFQTNGQGAAMRTKVELKELLPSGTTQQ